MTNFRSPLGRSRAGAVLPLVLFGIVILGIAAASGSFVERADSRTAGAARLHAQVATTSELAAVEALDELRGAPPHDLAVGATRARLYTPADPAVQVVVLVSRLGETLYSIESRASPARSQPVGSGSNARQAVGSAVRLLARLDAVAAPLVSGLSSTSPPVLGAAVVDGLDSTDGSDCPPPESDDLPVTAADPAARDSTIAILQARATKRYPAGSVAASLAPEVAAGRCETGSMTNWGDPSGAGACASFLPVVLGEGDLTIVDGVGQGVVVADGDLQVTGAFRFEGLIIARGTVSITGAGVAIAGGVVAGHIDAPAAASAPIIRRSTCLVRRALLAAAPLVPLGERPWGSVP